MNGKRQTAKCKLMCTHKCVHAKFQFCEFDWMAWNVLPRTPPFFVHCIRQTRGKSKLHWNYTEQWAHNSYRINAGDEFVLCLTSEKWRQQTDIINRLYRIQWAIRKLFFFLLFIWFVWSKHQLGFFVRK